MRQYQFEYIMSIQFNGYVEEHNFALKCLPFYDSRQKYYKLTHQVTPFCSTWKSKDSFENNIISGYCKPVHNQFQVAVTGVAEINNDNKSADKPLPSYRFASRFTQNGPFVAELLEDRLPVGNLHELVLQLMAQIHAHMVYTKDVTTSETIAKDAYEQKKGVCQDYAHILLAALRSQKIASRYVAGMVEGVGETHAWIEVFIDNLWIGYDPTRNIMVDDSYLKFSHGRDAEDCLVNRGLFVGNASQTMTVSAKMTQLL